MQETSFICLFWPISMLPDPHPNTDPGPDRGQPNQCGSGSGSTTLVETPSFGEIIKIGSLSHETPSLSLGENWACGAEGRDEGQHHA